MAKKSPENEKFEQLVDKIVHTYKGDSGINFIDASNLPVRGKIVDILELFMEVIFPGYTGRHQVTKSNVKATIAETISHVYKNLAEQLERAYRYSCRMKECDSGDCHINAQQVANFLLNQIPAIRELLKGDVAAAFDGDPAAQSYEEIVISYPCIIAIATHRIAHHLYLKEVPLIPRIMAEWAHSRTGIDIHPGARIGKSFFIDHGTGVVIGETSIIGNNVKIYQGATLGAHSFRKDARGRIIKGGKRHPTIEDNVTIYAEATLLGDITVGKGSTVGGNAWIKNSVPPGVTVMVTDNDLVYKKNGSK